MQRNKAGTKKINPDGLSLPNQNTNNNNNIVVFYKIWKKYDEIKLTKNKIDLSNFE